MGQTPYLIRIGRAEFVGEFRLSVKRLCFCLVIYNECEYIKQTSKPVFVLDDQERV